MGLFAQFNANHENLQHESSVRRSKLQLQSQQQNVKTSNTPVTVIDVKTRNMPPEIIEYALKISRSLIRNKGFLVNLKTERNASNFAMFMEKENPCSFFRFSFRATFIFPL